MNRRKSKRMWLFPRERTVRKATAHCKERERKAFLFAPRGSRSVIERTAFGCLTSVAVTEREKEKERKRKGKREREEGRGWEAQTQRQAKKARTRTNSIVQRGVNGLASCLARPDSAHGALVAQIINYGAIFGSPRKKKTRRACTNERRRRASSTARSNSGSSARSGHRGSRTRVYRWHCRRVCRRRPFCDEYSLDRGSCSRRGASAGSSSSSCRVSACTRISCDRFDRFVRPETYVLITARTNTAKRTPPAVAPKPPKGSVAATATPAAPAVAAAAAPVQVRNRLDQLFAEGPPPSVVASAATAPVIGESASSEPTAVASPAAVPKNRGGVGLVGLGTHTALKPSSVAHSSTSAAAEQSASTAAPPAPSNGLKTSLSLNSLPPPEAPVESEDPPAPSAQRMSGTMRVKSGWGRLKDLLAKGGDVADLLAKGGDAADGIADGGNAVMEPFPDGEWEADDLAVTAAEEPQAEEPVGPTKARARSNSIAAVDSLVQTASNATQYLNIKYDFFNQDEFFFF